jgi:thiamine-monophosphate kinase
MPTPGEFEIIARYFTRPSAARGVELGIGDDAAILVPDGPLAIACDMLVAGTHFPEALPGRAIGHRALAVNLSDLAAMGARPRWATLALSLPVVEPDWLEDFAAGLFALADRYGVALVGGDTTRGPLTMTVTVLGDAAARPLLRSGGRPGDRIFVSGTLGDAAAALEPLGRREPPGRADAGGGESPCGARAAAEAVLIERFSWPEPRVALGLALTGLARAAIDISDGLVADLGHICTQSGCGALVDLARLPVSTELASLHASQDAEEFALYGGDDYELCFAVSPDAVDRVVERAAECGTPVTGIGELTAEPGIRGLRDGESAALDARGFVHF